MVCVHYAATTEGAAVCAGCRLCMLICRIDASAPHWDGLMLVSQACLPPQCCRQHHPNVFLDSATSAPPMRQNWKKEKKKGRKRILNKWQ